MAKFELTKIETAVDQLDWAIRLFLDHSAFAAAITLAGAAEEILGKAAADRSAFEQLKKKFSNDFSLPEKVISQAHLNRAKNWLKHWDGCADEEKIILELDEESIQYIMRALANLVAHDGSLPSEGPRFIIWLRRNRADLWDGDIPSIFDQITDSDRA
jgi:hypothetical protein